MKDSQIKWSLHDWGTENEPSSQESKRTSLQLHYSMTDNAQGGWYLKGYWRSSHSKTPSLKKILWDSYSLKGYFSNYQSRGQTHQLFFHKPWWFHIISKVVLLVWFSEFATPKLSRLEEWCCPDRYKPGITDLPISVSLSCSSYPFLFFFFGGGCRLFYWFFWVLHFSQFSSMPLPFPFNSPPRYICSQFTQEILPFFTSHVD